MKQPKKLWAWTAKQKQKRHKCKWMGKAPNSYTKSYWGTTRTNDQAALRDELNGLDGIFSGRTQRNTAQWDWW